MVYSERLRHHIKELGDLRYLISEIITTIQCDKSDLHYTLDEARVESARLYDHLDDLLNGLGAEETQIRLLREYKDTGSMTQHYLADPRDCDEDGLVWDEFHNERREIWDAGPEVDEIGWSRFPKEDITR